MERKIKVLIADDSPFIRHILTDFISTDPQLELVAGAKNGREALELIPRLKPDVVTLDYEMPFLDGLSALKEIMENNPTPVIMISSHTREGAQVTLEALEKGAVDFLAKPEGHGPLQLYKVREEFLQKVHAAAGAFEKKPVLPETKELSGKPSHWKPFSEGQKLIVIATSSGGPRALQAILPNFSPNIPAGIVIVQHMPAAFTGPLAKRLDRESRIPVREAAEGDPIRPGEALVAPGDYHLTIGKRHRIELNKKNPLWGVRPAADFTFLSAAPVFRENLTGIVLTGMGRDGANGLLQVKKSGGRTLVQDEKSSTVFGMPRAAIKAGAADLVLPLEEIIPFVNNMFITGEEVEE